MNYETATRIIEFLEQYDKHFSELRTFLSSKQEKVVGDDLVWLLDSLTEEQKLVMRGNSMEAKRLTLLSELGYNDYTSDMLYEEFPENLKGKFKLYINSMNDSIDFIKRTNEGILDLVERKLEVQAELVKDANLTGSDTYDNSGTKIHKISGDIIGTV